MVEKTPHWYVVLPDDDCINQSSDGDLFITVLSLKYLGDTHPQTHIRPPALPKQTDPFGLLPNQIKLLMMDALDSIVINSDSISKQLLPDDLTHHTNYDIAVYVAHQPIKGGPAGSKGAKQLNQIVSAANSINDLVRLLHALNSASEYDLEKFKAEFVEHDGKVNVQQMYNAIRPYIDKDLIEQRIAEAAKQAMIDTTKKDQDGASAATPQPSFSNTQDVIALLFAFTQETSTNDMLNFLWNITPMHMWAGRRMVRSKIINETGGVDVLQLLEYLRIIPNFLNLIKIYSHKHFKLHASHSIYLALKKLQAYTDAELTRYEQAWAKNAGSRKTDSKPANNRKKRQ